MKQKSYQHFKDTQLFQPNQMSYVELAFESILQGEDNGLSQAISPYQDIDTPHRAICDILRAQDSEADTASDDVSDYYRRYGHLHVDLGLFDDFRVVPLEPSGSHPIRSLYCSEIAYEFMHTPHEEQAWFIDLLENKNIQISEAMLLEAYGDIARSDGLEKFLGIQFVGQKRFSLEGCETLIPLLERLIKQHVTLGYDDIVMGMPHRGRINTLVNVLGVSVESIVNMFQGESTGEHSGDVKYHLGHSVHRHYGDKSYHVALSYNPSHLEAINAVVCGNVRAKIDRGQTKPFGILLHGDAAISGQGVIMETLNMSQVPAYHIGGVVHIVVNNQIGFTTDPRDGRSSPYCTDIAKMIQAPVMHVSADKVESVLKVAIIAAMYRDRFKKDVFIDMIGYRKYGHNEADEPRSTQPLLYQTLKEHPGVLALFKKALLKKGISEEKLQGIEKEVQKRIKAKSSLIDCDTETKSKRHEDWVALDQVAWDAKYSVGVTQKLLELSAKQLVTLPKEFSLQKQVEKLMLSRMEMAKGAQPLNWGMAELLAYQVLLNTGHSVRLVGQDVIRGTFSHRMASLYDQKTGKRHELLVSNEKAKFYNYNSILSEYACLGFEYGYAEARPYSLVVFEAQFGDFINGAQIIIDQFISSGYQKWQRYCHLVMLLPHGYEGQGPEHSSARLERFLQLCAEDNIQVCVPSTPRQIYHLLLRQVMRQYRRPLIVMSPKSLLRHPEAISSLDELSGSFEVCLGDEKFEAKTVVLCSGKVYYDLLKKREDRPVSIIRIEQLHPFPHRTLSRMLEGYTQLEKVIWCQEEPLNQGAWLYLRDWLQGCLSEGIQLDVVGREPAASPSVGYMKRHQMQQEALMKQVFEEKL